MGPLLPLLHSLLSHLALLLPQIVVLTIVVKVVMVVGVDPHTSNYVGKMVIMRLNVHTSPRTLH